MSINHSEDYYLRVLFEKAKIKELMKIPPINICEDEEISVAHKMFQKHNLSHLMLVDDERKFTGLISPKYLYKTLSPKKMSTERGILEKDPNILIDGDKFFDKDALDSFILRDIMYKNPFTLKPDDTIALAVINMHERNISCIPIIDDEMFIKGVLTSNEIVEFVAKTIIE